MEELTADDIIAAIRQVLNGQMTQPQLATWANRARMNDLNGAHPLEWRYQVELSAVLYQLMALDMEPEFEVSPADLEAIVESLSRLGSA